MCVDSHSPDGKLEYCEHGHHLAGCHMYECSGTFKCRNSHCILTHKVCDGIWDCPVGDDESHCPITECENMIRCGYACVHPNQICGSEMNCLSGEDEKNCGVSICPDTCECLTHSIKCVNFTGNYFPSSAQFFKLFLLEYTDPALINDFIEHFQFILKLRATHNNLHENHMHCIRKLDTLLPLNSSHNSITLIQSRAFDGLASLIDLDVS